jgi:hypothetical protein
MNGYGLVRQIQLQYSLHGATIISVGYECMYSTTRARSIATIDAQCRRVRRLRSCERLTDFERSYVASSSRARTLGLDALISSFIDVNTTAAHKCWSLCSSDYSTDPPAVDKLLDLGSTA